MSAGTQGKKLESARTVISASISKVSVTRQAAPIQPSSRASFSIGSSSGRSGKGAAALRLFGEALTGEAPANVPSPALAGEGCSEFQRRRMGEGIVPGPSPDKT